MVASSRLLGMTCISWLVRTMVLLRKQVSRSAHAKGISPSTLSMSIAHVLTFDPELRKQIVALMEEVVAAGRACGADLDESCIESMVAMTEKMAPYHPSMYIDYAAGRRMEIEFMYERPIEEAKAHGVDMVLTKALAERLRGQ